MKTRWGASGSELSVDHTTRCHNTTLDEVNTVKIVKSRLYKERAIGWRDNSWPVKKGDLGRAIIQIAIKPHILDVVCDLGVSVNIIPMVVYDNVLRLALLLRTNMRVRFVDQSTHRVEGIIDDVYVLVGDSHMVTDFVVLDIRRDQTTPIILGRPFLRTTKATI